MTFKCVSFVFALYDVSELVQLYSRIDSNANVRIPGPYILVWVTGVFTRLWDVWMSQRVT